MYLNFGGFAEEKEELVRAGYGPNYERLAALKAKYDPANLFRMNQNIVPARCTQNRLRASSKEETMSSEGARPLSGRVAIVTGGGRGIGREIALTYTRAGAAVTVTARSANELDETVALIEQGGGRALAIPADVTDRQAVDAMVARTEAELGPIDILVNNAGSYIEGVDYGRHSWEDDPEGWWQTVEVNLKGPFLCARAALPGMVARRTGRIINLASGAALMAIARGQSYGPSKVALIRWTKALAGETTPFGISVFAMEPGVLHTTMVEDGIKAGAAHFLQRRETNSWTPMEEATGLALSLATAKIAALTGRFFSIYDDIDEKIQRVDEIIKGELYTLRMQGLPEQPAAGWMSGKIPLKKSSSSQA